jgi:hypothetical protein
MKYLLLAALFVGFNLLPGTATHAEDTMPNSGNIVQKEAGLVTIPSRHSVDETVDKLKNILQSKTNHSVCADRPQRRSGKGGTENASHQAADIWQPEKGARLSCWLPQASPSTFHSRFWLQRTPKEKSGCRTTARTT